MLEVAINSTVTTVVAGPDAITPPGGILYFNGTLSAIPVTYTRQGSTQFLSVSFTPTATGIYTVYAFDAIQFRVNCVPQLSYDIISNLQDEALGSWTWDKTTGILTMLRQNSTTLATFTAQDTLTNASRERTS